MTNERANHSTRSRPITTALEPGEERVEVRPFLITMGCSQCGRGELVSVNGVVLMSDPPMNPHKCSNCGYEVHLRGRHYPELRWERVKQ